MAKIKSERIRHTRGDRALYFVTTLVLVLLIFVVAYPVAFVISSSFSSSRAIGAGRVLLWPVEFTLKGYAFVFQYEKIWLGYRNTLFYTFFGTLITMGLTILCAYPLSKSHFQGRKVYSTLLVITMLFSAGLIPTYIIRAKLGLVDTVWAILLAGAMSVYNMTILRTSFKSSIPQELFDAAEIDGAGDFQCLIRIAIPLAKATISVLTLYTVVGCWNDYFNAMIYLRSENLFPLQLFLRPILTAGQMLDTSGLSSSMIEAANEGTQQIKYCLIILSTVPVLLAYSVVQKYFKKGVMVGSVKG